MKKYILLIILLLISLLLLINKVNADTTQCTYIDYTVKANDTLWKIASIYCDNNTDIREYISEIKKDNDIDTIIHQGQVLKIKRALPTGIDKVQY